jgi:hypothetical protein
MFPPGDVRPEMGEIAYREHLAEFSHELTTRPGRPHIPSKKELERFSTGTVAPPSPLARLGAAPFVRPLDGQIPAEPGPACGSVAQVVRAHA